MEAQITYQSIFFNLKSPLLYIWCICVAILFYICFFLQVDNLNLVTILENYYFYAMLTTCKCMPICKKMDCDAKSEPPYLATTQLDVLDKVGRKLFLAIQCSIASCAKFCVLSPYFN
jgi:hypothetical protein